MGSKRVRWREIKPQNRPPLTCHKCHGDGVYEGYHAYLGEVTTLYCDCPAGRRRQHEDRKHRGEVR